MFNNGRLLKSIRKYGLEKASTDLSAILSTDHYSRSNYPSSRLVPREPRREYCSYKNRRGPPDDSHVNDNRILRLHSQRSLHRSAHHLRRLWVRFAS